MENNSIVFGLVQLTPSLIGQLHLWNYSAMFELKIMIVPEYLVTRELFSICSMKNKL